MYGLGLPSAQLRHAFGGAARGGQKQNVQIHLLKQPHNGPGGGGLACAGTSGKQQQSGLSRQAHRLPLQRRVAPPLSHLHLPDDLVRISRPFIGKTQHGKQLLRHKALRLIQIRSIAGQHIGHLLLAYIAFFHHGVQADLHLLTGYADELRRRQDQFLPRQKHMAVSLVILQLIHQRRPGAAAAFSVKAHTQGHLVRLGKVHAELLPGQKIRILPQPVQCLRPIDPVCLHRQMHRKIVPGHKLHGPPQARQLPERPGQLHGFLGGDPLDAAELLRLLLQYPQGIGAEGCHQPLRRGLPHSLENAGGKIAHHLLLIPGQAALRLLAGDLGAIQGMGDPYAGDGHPLARGGIGDAPHHSDDLPQLRQQREHRIPVFLILEDHRLYGSLHCAPLTHSLSSLLYDLLQLIF